MNTGENEQGLRKIMDLTRWISVGLLLLHFYYFQYGLFLQRGWRLDLTDRILLNIEKTGLFDRFHTSKCLAILMLLISLIGSRGRKNEQLKQSTAFGYLITGLCIYFSSVFLLQAFQSHPIGATIYILLTLVGYILVLTGGTLLSRIIYQRLNPSVFNTLNETFPQEERKLENEYSINLPARYNLKGRIRNSWINIINPFRGLLVMGTPGSGKSYFIIQHIITQHIQKGFTMFVYDFKFDDLTRHTYSQYLKYKHHYPIPPKFYIIDFDRIHHRCNPIHPSTLQDITDAAESSRTIMLGLNKEWIKKQGDFFVESPINFITALIWFLRNYQNGNYCSLPHVIELAQVEYSKLFSILRTDPQIEVLINPFVSAFLNDAMEQLEGQIASAKISLAKLASPQLYYVLTGNDFTLDINNPKEPKIVCMGNNPQKAATYGAVVSLYVTALTRLINQRNRQKSSLVFDEFPTIYFNGIDNLIATARSNKVATTLAVQDASQLKLHYGKEQAEVILNIVGNVISGQVSGDTAKQLSERFGRIMQDRESISINRQDISVTRSKQLESAIPPSKITSLSSGEFVGVVADNPDQKIILKAFCAEILARESEKNERPGFERETSHFEHGILNSYLKVKKDMQLIVHIEFERMLDTPDLSDLIIRKS